MPAGLSGQVWRDRFNRAYQALLAEVEAGRDPFLDPYAATGPAEFFAVLSERYFKHRDAVAQVYPDLFELLEAFYQPTRSAVMTGRA